MTSFLRLLLVTALALAVGILVGAAVTFGSDHRRQMAPPLPANLALYEPEEPDPSAAGRYATLLRDQGDGAGRVPASGGLTGFATWYATGPDCLCAAAGPALRVGDWRGSTVTVTANGRLIEVTLADACWCVDRHGLPTLLDLSDEAVAALGLDPRRGIYAVEVRP